MLLFILFNLEIKFDYKTGTFLDRNREHHLIIFYKIPRNQITYIKQKDKFIAGLEIICKLTQKHKEFGNINYIKDTLKDYDETIKKIYINGNIKIKVVPEDYNLEMQIKDLNSQRIGKIKSNVSIKNLIKQDGISTSSIVIIDDTTIYFEVYNPNKALLGLSYKIKKDTLCIAKAENIEISEKFINPIYIHLKNIPYGYNLIKLELKGMDYNLSIQDTIYKEEPIWIKNYEKMVKELFYIAKKEEIDSLLKAPIEKREKEWKNFWSKKDSAFGKSNVEEEYFKRVSYANENFSCGIEGWKTDRGRVYIKLGPPDEIESRVFEIDSPPYEIWYYYRKGLKFVFVDKHGFGEYALVYPNYWDEEIQIE